MYFSDPSVQHPISSTSFQMSSQVTTRVDKGTLTSTLLVIMQDLCGLQDAHLCPENKPKLSGPKECGGFKLTHDL